MKNSFSWRYFCGSGSRPTKREITAKINCRARNSTRAEWCRARRGKRLTSTTNVRRGNKLCIKQERRKPFDSQIPLWGHIKYDNRRGWKAPWFWLFVIVEVKWPSSSSWASSTVPGWSAMSARYMDPRKIARRWRCTRNFQKNHPTPTVSLTPISVVFKCDLLFLRGIN